MCMTWLVVRVLRIDILFMSTNHESSVTVHNDITIVCFKRRLDHFAPKSRCLNNLGGFSN